MRSNELIPRMTPKKASESNGDNSGVLLYQSTLDGCLYFVDQKGIHRGLREKGSLDIAETILTVIQPSHGFILPTEGFIPVHKSNTVWTVANTSTPEFIHEAYIIEVVDNDTFKVQQSGFLTVPNHGLNVGSYYFSLSTGNIGTAPDNTISDVVCFVINSSTIMLIDNRPNIGSEVLTTEEQHYDTVSLIFDLAPFYLNLQYKNHHIVLTKSATLIFQNGIVGETYKIRITQGGLAPKVIAFGPGIKTPGGSGITLSTGIGEEDILDVYFNGTDFYVTLNGTDFQ
jgi:hypothetical protein